MPVEGRDLSSRQTQDVVRDLEIGQPINSEECSETAEGVPRPTPRPNPHSASGTLHSRRQPCSRAAAPPCRTYSCESRMPRLPPVPKVGTRTVPPYEA